MSARTEFLRRLLESPRFEILPTASVLNDVTEHLPPGRTLTVTASTSLGLDRTLSVAEELQRRGYRAVPHLAARMISGRTELEDITARLREAGVDSVFVPGGDATPPGGAYPAALDLLRDLQLLGSPFAQVGVAGYPESHPAIPDEVLIAAMADKRDSSTHIVSNLCFDPDRLVTWVRALRDRGETHPVLIGVAGKVERAKLLRVATAIGVGESTKFLSKNKMLFARMFTPGGYNPGDFLQRALPGLADEAAGVAGLHVYTFNQIGVTEKWRQDELEHLASD